MKGITVGELQNTRPGKSAGSFITFLDEPFYQIKNYNSMPAFFMTIVSSSDVWNYLWSNGGLTAGRINCDNALFPYYTADKVSDDRTYTGPYSAVNVYVDKEIYFWEPFTDSGRGIWKTERNLYKNTSGSKVYFEEINLDLGLTFQYGWMSSDTFGLVRHTRIINHGKTARKIAVLDGCRNILPASISSDFQNNNSVLLDAYKKTDLDYASGIAVFSVTSIVTDKAEPCEGLFANVGWFSCEGSLCLSPSAPEAFRYNEALSADTVIKGERPSFFIHRETELAPGEAQAQEWYQVFDTGLDLSAIVALKKKIASRAGVAVELKKDIAAGVALLEQYIADADGMQDTADRETCVHHEANVMFNIMRGGIFAENDTITISDFLSFAAERSRDLLPPVQKAVASLGEKVRYKALHQAIQATGNPQLDRIFLEYLPLTFSRRHGDPSRPWNRFAIELKDAKGNRRLSYQGNWRDIFQNWEALALSWPQFTENMTAKFLNASTADGFNPYRITREGIDWEVQEPDNPWSNIGYWGDHQVIYLAKLLELQNRFNRAQLLSGLDRVKFSSGNVPYRLKSYADIVKNPRSTIIFDAKLHEEIQKRAALHGSDAKLVQTADGQVALVSMTEKILMIVLAKMANLVPGGGVWLNTQRPEWNDANNALAGYGLSMVTLYYLRRFMVFLLDLYKNTPLKEFALTAETASFFTGLSAQYRSADPAKLNTPAARRAFMDKAGLLFEAQRNALYASGFSKKTKKIQGAELIAGLESFLHHAEETIRENKRDDGLYHAYNTMVITPDGGMEVHHLVEMLEGQVALLSSGFLTGKETLELCSLLKNGPLFRADQYSYILYPEKELPLFCAKNNVSAKDASAVPLLASMLAKKDTSLIHADGEGTCHFNPSFRNARDIDEAIVKCRSSYDASLLASSERAIHALYETTFNHQSFTGRSGTFYAYEGIGSIYWHMVAKLMLAVQEVCLAEKDAEVKAQLAETYYDIRKGIGFNKTPAVYGAFPTDPYSHTPMGQGAKQPGMTGQVKEEIITRWGELGLEVKDGKLSINPEMLRGTEFHADGHLGFSWCGVPFVYHCAPGSSRKNPAGGNLRITAASGGKTEVREIKGNTLGAEESGELFMRSGVIKQVEYFML